MKRTKRLLAPAGVGLAALLSCANVAWANYTCSGLVKGVSIDLGSGSVLVQNIGSLVWPRLCSFRSSSENGVQPDDCKRIYATLLAAQAEGRSVTFWVNDPGTTCPTLPAWQYVQGIYLLRIDN